MEQSKIKANYNVGNIDDCRAVYAKAASILSIEVAIVIITLANGLIMLDKSLIK